MGTCKSGLSSSFHDAMVSANDLKPENLRGLKDLVVGPNKTSKTRVTGGSVVAVAEPNLKRRRTNDERSSGGPVPLVRSSGDFIERTAGETQLLAIVRSVQLLIHNLCIRSGGGSTKKGRIPVGKIESEFEKRFKVPLQFSPLFGPAKTTESALSFVLSFPNLFRVTSNGIEPVVRCLRQAENEELFNENSSSASANGDGDDDDDEDALKDDDGMICESTDPETFLRPPMVEDLPKGAGMVCPETGNGAWLLPPCQIPSHLRRFELGAAEKFTGLALNLIAEEKHQEKSYNSMDDRFAEFDHVEEFIHSLGGLSRQPPNFRTIRESTRMAANPAPGPIIQPPGMGNNAAVITAPTMKGGVGSVAVPPGMVLDGLFSVAAHAGAAPQQVAAAWGKGPPGKGGWPGGGAKAWPGFYM